MASGADIALVADELRLKGINLEHTHPIAFSVKAKKVVGMAL